MGVRATRFPPRPLTDEQTELVEGLVRMYHDGQAKVRKERRQAWHAAVGLAEMVGVSEASRRLGISRVRVYQLADQLEADAARAG